MNSSFSFDLPRWHFPKLINNTQCDQGQCDQDKKVSETDYGNELKFYMSKNETIRAEFNDLDNDRCHDFDESVVLQHVRKFEPVTIEQVLTIIITSVSKTCDLDPFPTSILKTYTNKLVPTNTNIINLSLQSARMPTELKHAMVMPRIKNLLNH